MKRLVVTLMLVSMVGTAMGDIGAYAPASNRKRDAIALDLGMSRILGDYSQNFIECRVSGAVADDIVVGVEIYAPDTFDGVGVAMMAQAFFPTTDFPVDFALHGGMWFPVLGGGVVILDGAVMALVTVPKLHDVELYAAVGGLGILDLEEGEASFEPRFAAGILCPLPIERASIYAEISEAGGTFASVGVRIAIQ